MPSIKNGPGDSARSHSADEHIYLSEISDGITIYIDLLDSIIPYLAKDNLVDLKVYESQHQ